MNFLKSFKDSHPFESRPPTQFQSLFKSGKRSFPIIHIKLTNNKQITKKFNIYRPKHFAKLSATGQDTSLILQSIVKSQNVKYSPKFEFDPYLCDESYLKLLSQAIRKLKNINDINLVIRRMDRLNESNILSKSMARLVRLKKFRLELPMTTNLTDEGFTRLGKMFGKAYSLQTIENVFNALENVTLYGHLGFSAPLVKLTRVERLKRILQKTSVRSLEGSNPKINMPKKIRSRVKEIDSSIGMNKGWHFKSFESDSNDVKILGTLALHKDLQILKLRFVAVPLPFETIQILSTFVPGMINLRFFSLEFINCKVSEEEIVMFTQLLPELSQLERVTFKVIQHPNVSEMAIYYLISTISKLQNFKTFDIYFRRLSLPDENITCIVDKINQLENVHCSRYKASLHFSRCLNIQPQHNDV